jgi:hypothetical protein
VVELPIDDRFYTLVVQTGMSGRRVLSMPHPGDEAGMQVEDTDPDDGPGGDPGVPMDDESPGGEPEPEAAEEEPEGARDLAASAAG